MFNSLLRKGLASRIFAYAEPCVRLWDAFHAESDTTARGLKRPCSLCQCLITDARISGRIAGHPAVLTGLLAG